MKSKASYFSISKPLIIENLRRFWAIPALSFLVYFLSGVFPILMTYSHLNDLASYIKLSLNNQQPFYMFAHLIFPIMAAVVIFRYLQGISSVSVMHALPFTRAKLYNSGFLSGLILIIVPILANGVILLAISKPAYHVYGTESGLVTETVNAFARADILNWIWISILITVIVYAVSVFAGIVTGNSLMHFAAAIWFNFLIPSLYGVLVAYFAHFLYGFDASSNYVEFGMTMSPFLNALQNAGHFGIYSTIYYIVSFFLLYGVTNFLYQKRKLEHATDSLAFGFLEPVICYLIAFLGMTLLGFYFEVLGKSQIYMYAGLAAGTVIFFIIGQMIVKKTPRIYNMKSLKSLGIYVLIAVLFLLGLNIDVTGFETRVPDPDEVDRFTLSESFTTGYSDNFDYMNGYSIRENGKGNEHGLFFDDPDNIKAAAALHEALIQNRSRLEVMDNIYMSNVHFEYNPDSVFPMTRSYQIDYSFFKSSGEFKQIYESEEFKNFYAPGNLNYVGLKKIYVGTDSPGTESVEIESREDIMEFMSCLDKDFKAQSFEDMVSLKHSYAAASIEFTYKNKTSDTPEKILNNSITYQITPNYKNTIQWLADHGYTEKLARKASNIEYIELYHYVKDENTSDPEGRYFEEGVYEGKMIPASGKKSLKVTEPAQIQKLLDTYETQNTNYNDFYYGTIYYKWSSEQEKQYFEDAYGYKKEMAEKYGTKYASDSVASMQIYFNEGNIPDYVLDYFK